MTEPTNSNTTTGAKRARAKTASSVTNSKPDRSAPEADAQAAAAGAVRQPRGAALIELMRAEGGKSAAELGAAVGWQKHSVRGFISGTLKKRADLELVVAKTDGATRYQVRDRAAAQP